MATIPELVAELRATIDGVTPGGWFVSGVRFRMNGGDWHSVNRYDEALKRDENIACIGYDPRTGDGLADAHHIARCSPDNIRLLLDWSDDLVAALKAEQTADEADEAHREICERADAEDWLNDPTGSMHVHEAGMRALKLRQAAKALRDSALARLTEAKD